MEAPISTVLLDPHRSPSHPLVFESLRDDALSLRSSVSSILLRLKSLFLNLDVSCKKYGNASGCFNLLIRAVESQVHNNKTPLLDNFFPCKRMADGSKRIRVPHFVYKQVRNLQHKLNMY